LARQLLDPEASQPRRLGLQGRRLQLVGGHVAGDVLVAEIVEPAPTATVAAVGAKPSLEAALGQLRRRRHAVVDAHDPPAVEAAFRTLDPPGCLTGQGDAAPDRRRCGPEPCGAGHVFGRHEHLGEVTALLPDPHLCPPVRRAFGDDGRQVVQQLVRHHHSRERATGQVI